MRVRTITCAHCHREQFALAGLDTVYCQCRFLWKNGNKHTPLIPDMGEEYEIGESWQRAGMKYDEMVRRVLLSEKFTARKRSILIAGNGARLSVKHGSLLVQHGLTYTPKEALTEQIDRGVHDVHRIVWVAASGNISYAAMKWCEQQNIDLLILDNNGNIVCESGPTTASDIAVKRAQYTISSEREVDIARWFILAKILGQYNAYRVILESQKKQRVMPAMYGDMSELDELQTIQAFESAISWLSADRTPKWENTLANVRMYEARAANAYFLAWRDIRLNWNKADRVRIPAHWHIVGDRVSPIGNKTSVENAVRPAQAILNYAYGVLEHMSRAALLAVGLDIDVGILHADKPGRNSLVYDLMEVGRGAVEMMVLSFFKAELHKGDFLQAVSGECRLHPEMARAVVALCSIPQEIMVQYAYVLRNMILSSVPDTDEMSE